MKQLRYIAGIFLILTLFAGGLNAVAATQDDVEERQEELESDLRQLEKEIEAQEKILNVQRQASASFQRDVNILDAQIRKAQLSIQHRNLAIQQLTGEIGERQSTIGSLSEKLEREKDSLAQLIRKTNQSDDASLVEIMLGKQDLSEFFEDVDSFDAIKASLQESFRDIEYTKGVTREEQKTLEAERVNEEELKNIQELEKQKVELQEAEKQRLLDASRGQEAVYQAVITQKEQTAAQIRAELFKLRGSTAISFGEALDFANSIGAKTGVRPAFILGVIQEETRLGEFLGTGNWKIDSHPTRDKWIFAVLMEDLGLDPDAMPVSKAPSYGYGGAMGPAQFIPSTWVLYAGYSCNSSTQTCSYNKSSDRIGGVTGNHPPNPYNPEDAFTASALLLGDNGADRGGYYAEWLAAQRYFAGWANAEKPQYAFYGNEVMALAEGFQRQIDILEG